jgi:hypothetical protein
MVTDVATLLPEQLPDQLLNVYPDTGYATKETDVLGENTSSGQPPDDGGFLLTGAPPGLESNVSV